MVTPSSPETQRSAQIAPLVVVQQKPPILFVRLPGHWLFAHSTPSWRLDNPEHGFQRIVNMSRAKEIAVAVLDQKRTFPNAIVLATDKPPPTIEDEKVTFPGNSKFLVVDGQHRLYAQNFSNFEAQYPCMVHMNLTEVEMARLFLEINDNQRRVPSSLRWDLVRLVRPADDSAAVAAAELVMELTTREESALFQRIDRTGEIAELSLKQGSVAPELHTLIRSKSSPLRSLDFDTQYSVLNRYFIAIKSLDPDGWKRATTPFYKARVVRALLRLLPDIIDATAKPAESVDSKTFKEYLRRIDPVSLSDENIRAKQGNAGINDIYLELRGQALG